MIFIVRISDNIPLVQGEKRRASHQGLVWGPSLSGPERQQGCPRHGRALLAFSQPLGSIAGTGSGVNFLTMMTPASILGFPWGIFCGSAKEAQPRFSWKAEDELQGALLQVVQDGGAFAACTEGFAALSPGQTKL